MENLNKLLGVQRFISFYNDLIHVHVYENDLEATYSCVRIKDITISTKICASVWLINRIIPQILLK